MRVKLALEKARLNSKKKITRKMIFFTDALYVAMQQIEKIIYRNTYLYIRISDHISAVYVVKDLKISQI